MAWRSFNIIFVLFSCEACRMLIETEVEREEKTPGQAMPPRRCLICVPLITKTVPETILGVEMAKTNGADVVELRVDHNQGLWCGYWPTQFVVGHAIASYSHRTVIDMQFLNSVVISVVIKWNYSNLWFNLDREVVAGSPPIFYLEFVFAFRIPILHRICWAEYVNLWVVQGRVGTGRVRGWWRNKAKLVACSFWTWSWVYRCGTKGLVFVYSSLHFSIATRKRILLGVCFRNVEAPSCSILRHLQGLIGHQNESLTYELQVWLKIP